MNESRLLASFIAGVLCTLAVFIGIFSGKACSADIEEVLQGKTWEPGGYARPYLPYLHKIEREVGLPRNLLVAIADQESSFRPEIVLCKYLGPVGEKGMFQLRPEFHTKVNPCNPIDAARYTAIWLRLMYIEYGNWDLAVLGFHWGPGNVSKYIKGDTVIPDVVLNYLGGIQWKVFGRTT